MEKPLQVKVVRTRSTAPFLNLKERSEAYIKDLNKSHELELDKEEYRSLLVSHHKTKLQVDQLKRELQDPEYLIQQAVLQSYYDEQERLNLKKNAN